MWGVEGVYSPVCARRKELRVVYSTASVLFVAQTIPHQDGGSFSSQKKKLDEV